MCIGFYVVVILRPRTAGLLIKEINQPQPAIPFSARRIAPTAQAIEGRLIINTKSAFFIGALCV